MDKYIIEEDKKNYFNFIMHAYEDLQQYTESLKKHLNITNFGMLKIFFDSRYCYFTNNKELVKDYITYVKDTIIFFKQFLYSEDKSYKVIMWPDEPNHYSMDLYTKYGYWNGITLMREEHDHIKLWWFAADYNDNRVSSFLVRNINILIKFIAYFEQKTQHIFLDKAFPKLPVFSGGMDMSTVAQVQKITSKEDNRIEEFMRDIRLNKIDLNFANNRRIVLSSREIDCLELLSNGFQSKEIAKSLTLSPRTVESYIDNIKSKTGFYNRSSLVGFYNGSVKQFRF